MRKFDSPVNFSCKGINTQKKDFGQRGKSWNRSLSSDAGILSICRTSAIASEHPWICSYQLATICLRGEKTLSLFLELRLLV